MTTGQFLIMIFFFSFSGWFFAWMIIKILFWPVKPIGIGRFKIQGLIPARQGYLANKIGSLFQSAFHEYRGMDEQLSITALLEKLRPEIEDHVDHFLNEKLKTVFPLLSQFMGEKTIRQFKTAFLTEIDNLFPVLMKNHLNDLKDQIKIDSIISEKINSLSMTRMQEELYIIAGKEISHLKVACICMGLVTGIITSLILLLINF